MSRKFMEHIGFKTARVKNTMIIGGGNVAYYLAGQLVNMGISVKIIEENKKRCEELSVCLLYTSKLSRNTDRKAIQNHDI